MLNYNYPGNIRELQNLIERGVIYAEEDGAIDSVHMFRRGELIRNDVFALGSGGVLQHNMEEGAVIATGQSRGRSGAANGRDQTFAIEKISVRSD